MTFARRTTVSVEKTRAEIERVVKRYGAKGFASAWQGDTVRVEFLARDRHIRMTMTEPPGEQPTRSKWRSLLLLVKAKLEAVDAKITSFEEAFLGDIVMPDGRTVYEATKGPIKIAYEKREPTNLLTSSTTEAQQ
jgi:hypothetical protein